MTKAQPIIALLLLTANVALGQGLESKLTLESSTSLVQAELVRRNESIEETIRIKDASAWIPALSAEGFATRVVAGNPGELQNCTFESAERMRSPLRIVERWDCGAGILERTVALDAEPDVILVSVRFTPKPGASIHSIEDRYYFAPERHQTDTLTQGPLDFVWSQNLKREPDDLVPYWSFKSPAVMLQEGKCFVALMPILGDQMKVPVAFDLNVTSEKKPWFSFGAVASEPHDHSYFRRATNVNLSADGNLIEYSYAIVASSQPERLGYRRVVRRLWQTLGHPRLLQTVDLQRNVRRRELVVFEDWRKEAWHRYAGEVYRDVDCAPKSCGTLVSNRNYLGQWDKPEEDAWFNSWFQTLRTAYGWYLYGKHANDPEIQRKAEGILTLALGSPRQGGAFSTIYLVPEKKWVREDGWAGFPDDYHAFCMSWTAYWMLRWAEDLTPNRKDEILNFTRSYGDFLVKHQLPSGVIPSWYNSTLEPREEFRDRNAETAGSALFLLELGGMTGNKPYLQAGARAMEFISREILPRELWWDFETFLSCARKPFSFYDPLTAQYPQNNLSTMQAAMAYLKLYRISHDEQWLQFGTDVLDYLLLTQQVWYPPGFDPKLTGGFTTQNTDAEWSDARQGYGAVLLWDYYQETGELEYLERAVAAARSTLSVAPWENWAHTGYRNRPGAMTGFHWGTGSAMTSVEIMLPVLGDAFVDVSRKHGVGFNAVSLTDLQIDSYTISFDLKGVPELRTVLVKFVGLDPQATYVIVCNKSGPVSVKGQDLQRDGHVFAAEAAR
jgi:hypothetical protein